MRVGAHFAFRDANGFAGPEPKILDPKAFTGATIFGLAMFTSLFLGSVLAVFLTLGIVRGDAESGLLQPLVVRPIGRTTLLLSRFLAAAGLAAAYVLAIYAAALAITWQAGHWAPDHLLGPALALAFAVAIVAALSLLASTLALGDGAGDRRLHGLRRRPDGGAARPDRQRDQLRHPALDRPRPPAGPSPSRASTPPACTR